MTTQWFLVGNVGATPDEGRAAINGRRPLDLLALLLLHRNTSVTVDRIIDELWPDDPPRSARNTVQRIVSDLRTALGPSRERLLTDRAGYRLEVHDGEFDLAEIYAEIEQARLSVSSDPARAFAELLRSEAALAKPFAPGSSLPSVVRERQHIEGIQVALLEMCGELHILHGIGRLDQLQDWARRHPLNERLAGQLMTDLARSGRQADALGVYRAIRERLRDELGIEPSPALAEIELQVLRQGEALGATPAATVSESETETGTEPAALAAVVAANRASSRGLIGRSGLIAKIASTLETEPLVTLAGPGGVGKTALASAITSELDGRFDAIYMVSLADIARPELVVETVAAALDLGAASPGVSDRARLATTIAERLASHRCLLILDNAEHVVDATAELVAEILDHVTNNSVLLTSREHLALPMERVVVVEPLPTAAAVQLFAARGERVTGVDGADLERDPEAARICEALDGLPLAIELAAAQLKAFSTGELAARIHEPTRVLGTQRSSVRQASINSLLDWSWRLLNETERSMLTKLSLQQSITVDVAEFLDPLHGLQALSGLAAKSLVQVHPNDDGTSRYYLLETVRDYSRSRFADEAEFEGAHMLHAEWVLSRLRRASLAECLIDAQAHRSGLEIQSDVLSALEWVAVHGCVRHHLELAGRASGMFSHHGPFLEGRRNMKRAIDAIDLPCPVHGLVHDEEIDADLSGLALFGGAAVAQANGEGSEMVSYSLRASELAGEESFDWAPVALGSLAVYFEIGLLNHQAEDVLLRAEAVAPRTPSSSLNMASVAVWRGCWELMNRNYDEAIASFERALEIDPRRGQVMVLSEVGLLAALHLVGDHAAARRLASRAMSEPDTDAWHYCIDVFKAIAVGSERTAAAVKQLTNALGGSLDHDLPGRTEDVKIGTAVIAWHAGDRNRCMELLEDASLRGPAQMTLLVEYIGGQPGQSMTARQWRNRWREAAERCFFTAVERNEGWLSSIPEEDTVRAALATMGRDPDG